MLVAYMGQASHGWVLGARSSPFADLAAPPHSISNVAAGPDDRFRLDGDVALDHFSKRSSSRDYVDTAPALQPFGKRSGDDGTPIKLCGQYLDNLIRFVCRNYFNNHLRGKRSANDWTSIFSPEDYKVSVSPASK